ncbi:N-acetyltransferase [bacterium]|nr:N-acetyltransferase [bacterium]
MSFSEVTNNIKIKPANIEDAQDILNIYSYYVLNTAISFEYDVPTIQEFKERIRKTLENYPYYVAAINNKIVGYAYAGSFVGREAYKYSAELTIYIDKNYKKQGIGKLLYQKLEEDLKEKGIKNLYACVGIPVKESDEYLDFNSADFHKHLGFKQVGEFHKCGYKFNRRYSMIWLEKIIGE